MNLLSRIFLPISLYFTFFFLWLSSSFAYTSYSNLYYQKINQLAEVLGSLQLIDQICHENNDEWRQFMQKLIVAQRVSNERQKEIIGHFNRGYSSLSSTYKQCTKTAMEVQKHYFSEGNSLIQELFEKYTL